MTPTLLGRWQTRLFLFFWWGVPFTLLFGLLVRNVRFVFVVLAAAFFFGLMWDVLYELLQRFRWNRDWPPFFVLLTGLFEFVVLYVVFSILGMLLPREISALIKLPPVLNPFLFTTHYALVWFPMFLMMFGGMHVLSPKWRFNGGQWL